MDDDPGANDDAVENDDYVDSYEDVSVFHLDDERERNLLETQTECTFMWTTKDGDPVGVIMNFVSHDDRFWITCTRRRKRVAAVEARPHVAICITSRGTDIGAASRSRTRATRWFRERRRGMVVPGAGGTGPPESAGSKPHSSTTSTAGSSSRSSRPPASDSMQSRCSRTRPRARAAPRSERAAKSREVGHEVTAKSPVRSGGAW